VDDYVKPLVLKELDHSPYGVIPNSTTTLALISMLQHWSLGTDGTGSTVRTIVGRLTLKTTVLSSLNYISRVGCQLGFRLPI